MRLITLLFVSASVLACSSDSVPVASDVSDDTSDISDTSLPSDTSEDVDTNPAEDLIEDIDAADLIEDTGTDDADTVLVGPDVDEPIIVQPLDPWLYCELTAEMFCDYYMRCGRMHAETLDECHRNFSESCNARYEPLYASLAVTNEALNLNPSGLHQCKGHLATVACEDQLSDLDGCPNLWEGLLPQGARCGPGIESLVCGEGLGCVLGLDFCGTCQIQANTGEACDFDANIRCKDSDRCVDGVCVARGGHGASCRTTNECRISYTCRDGACTSPTWAEPGGSCANGERCPYRSTCIEGTCQQTALLGEPCGRAGCASGRCSEGICVPFTAFGEACTTHSQCVSGACQNGVCASPWCMDR